MDNNARFIATSVVKPSIDAIAEMKIETKTRNFFAASKPFLRQEHFGGVAGGPAVLPGYDDQTGPSFGCYEGVRI